MTSAYAASTVVIPHERVKEAGGDAFNKLESLMNKYELGFYALARSIHWDDDTYVEEEIYSYLYDTIDSHEYIENIAKNISSKIHHALHTLTKKIKDEKDIDIFLVSAYIDSEPDAPDEWFWATRIELSEKLKSIGGRFESWVSYDT